MLKTNLTQSDSVKKTNNLLNRQQIVPSDDNHQVEFVAEINGVSYVNDSKSIRLTSTRNSLELLKTPVVLIVGGDDRTNDYSVLSKQIKEKVISIIYLGSDNDQIFKHYSANYMLFSKSETIEEAVQIAAAYAKSGDTVLFSPACEHTDYKNRGNKFKAAVNNLQTAFTK